MQRSHLKSERPAMKTVIFIKEGDTRISIARVNNKDVLGALGAEHALIVCPDNTVEAAGLAHLVETAETNYQKKGLQ